MKKKIIILILIVSLISIFVVLKHSEKDNPSYTKGQTFYLKEQTTYETVVVNEYFQALSQKDFQKANKLVADDLQINDEEQKKYMKDTLISVKLLKLSALGVGFFFSSSSNSDLYLL